jgi:hypothetical protein
MKNKIEEIVLLAKDKGFEAKTMSTKFTMCGYLGINKANLSIINDTCDYLLLAEMQKWLRDKHDIFSEVLCGEYNNISKIRFESCVFSDLFESEDEEFQEENIFDSYELAMVDSLKEAFKLIKNK